MTIPIERTRAVLQTEQFLIDLKMGKYPRVPKAVREEAYRLLRHYPNASDIHVTNAGWDEHLGGQCPFASPDEKF